MTRYKHVVQVIIGQQLGAGCKYIARCRWDAECDNQAQSTFTTPSLFCIVTVFGIYLY
jgi:tctex1 domain-containing protein 2